MDLPQPPAEVRVGPGDDAAVLSNDVVISTDLAMEGVHFDLDWVSPTEAGYRSAAAGVSDLAAMAAEPIGILASIAAPGDGAVTEDLMAGVRNLASELGMSILGGDLTRSPGPIVLDIVSIGLAAKPLLRSGAQVGDELWVTGVLGGAAAAVALWREGWDVPEALRRRFASPSPRLAEARWLDGVGLHSGLDLSDGLAGDAGHIAAASGVAVVLDSEMLPLDPELEGLSLPQGFTALDLALHGGDDFELLVSTPAGRLRGSVEEFQRRFGIPLSQVGRVAEGIGVWLESQDSEGLKPIARGGYDHFGGRDDS